jgi:dTDP-4-dehydrorhamnose reductase
MPESSERRQRIVIIGAGGRLGAALVREYASDFAIAAFTHAQLDLGKPDQIQRTLGELEFDTLINCAAQTNVDRCETECQEAFALNGEAPRVLAEICAAAGARMIQIGTDYVFDGEKREPYTEEDDARPISVYGESKLAGDYRVLEASPRHIVARVSWVFGPDRPSFVDAVIKRARDEERVDAIADKWSAPSYTLDLAPMLRRLIVNRNASGIFHLCNRGECTWQQYGQWAVDCCHAAGIPLKAKTVGALRLADMRNFVARRPVWTVLATRKYERVCGTAPRRWQDAVAEYVHNHVAR